MNYRNSKLLENGWIDCEIEHPVHGWIPFTCDPEDSGSNIDVSELHAKMRDDPSTQPHIPPTSEDVLKEKVVEARVYLWHPLLWLYDSLPP